MIEFIIGLGMLLLSTPILLFADTGNVGAMFVAWVFLIIGVVVTIIGLIKLITNKSTDKNGEESYGFVLGLHEDGSYINGNPSYDVSMIIYRKYTGISKYKEKVGVGPFNYDVHDYVAIKYYKKDVNIICSVHESEIPKNILEQIQERLNVYK